MLSISNWIYTKPIKIRKYLESILFEYIYQWYRINQFLESDLGHSVASVTATNHVHTYRFPYISPASSAKKSVSFLSTQFSQFSLLHSKPLFCNKITHSTTYKRASSIKKFVYSFGVALELSFHTRCNFLYLLQL